MVTLLQVLDIASYLHDDSAAFMAEERWLGHGAVVHLVELRVADAAGDQLEHYLVGTRIGEIDLVDHQRLITGQENGGAGSHRSQPPPQPHRAAVRCTCIRAAARIIVHSTGCVWTCG